MKYGLAIIATLALAAPAQAFTSPPLEDFANVSSTLEWRGGGKGPRLAVSTALEMTSNIRNKDGVSGVGKLPACKRLTRSAVRCSYEDWTYDQRACVGTVTVKRTRRVRTPRASKRLVCRSVESAPEWTGLG